MRNTFGTYSGYRFGASWFAEELCKFRAIRLKGGLFTAEKPFGEHWGVSGVCRR